MEDQDILCIFVSFLLLVFGIFAAIQYMHVNQGIMILWTTMLVAVVIVI